MALFSCVSFEYIIAGLTWPCTLPPGWPVEWDASSANDDSAVPSDVTYGLHRDIQNAVSYRVYFSAAINNSDELLLGWHFKSTCSIFRLVM